MQVSRTAPIAAIPVRRPPTTRKGVTGPADHRLPAGSARRSRLRRANAAHGFAGDFYRLTLGRTRCLGCICASPVTVRDDEPSQSATVTRPTASLRRGSGYEQAKAELCRVEGEEVAVAFGPPA